MYTLIAYWLKLWILNFFVQQKKAKGEGQKELSPPKRVYMPSIS